jgi:hypothetical protein
LMWSIIITVVVFASLILWTYHLIDIFIRWAKGAVMKNDE